MMRVVFAIALVMIMMVSAALAEPTTISVSNADELKDAVDTINAATSGEFVIILDNDITVNTDIHFTSKATKTIQGGNGHTLAFGEDASHGVSSSSSEDEYYIEGFIVVWNGVLNLVGGEGGLTITSNRPTGDSSSGIQVVANKTNGDGSKTPVLNMYDGVTISNWKVDNSYGAGVRVYSHELEKDDLKATFNMHGGTIRDCGFTGGYNQLGGGVAVMYNGVFNMDGGVITGCSAINGGGVCLTNIRDMEMNNVNAPSFIMSGGSIEGNNAFSQSNYGGYGGGVAVLNGKFLMTGGNISGNNISLSDLVGYEKGGGVFVYVDPTDPDNIYDGEFELQSGTIENNSAVQGGGIFAQKRYVSVSDYPLHLLGGEIINNNAYRGGGIEAIQAYLNIQGTEITGNYADSYGGGGIYLSRGAIDLGTGSILCNNTSNGHSADFYGDNVTSVKLPSALGFNQSFDNTRFLIDGWYNDSSASRWDKASAFANLSTNTYEGDTINLSSGNIYLIAAFTAYDEIEITKTWDDADDVLRKRPDSLTFSLVDKDTLVPIKLRTYDETAGKWIAGGANATLTLSASDNWTGTIGPLLVDTYSDTSKYLLQEEEIGDFYILKDGDPNITFTADTWSDGTTTHTEPSGVYSASFTNTGRLPVTIAKIWDDVNDKDGKRPNLLNTRLVIGSTPQKDMDGQDVFQLSEDATTHTWTTTVYLPAKDYSALQATEGTTDGYEQTGYSRSAASDGKLTFVFVNKHTITPAATDTVRNDNMVEIHYQAAKEWSGTNPVGDQKLPRPEITVTLYADGVEYRSAVIDADTADPKATFSNVPKYRDNDGNEPIAYTIKEEITDAAWVKAGENLWYSLDGMGRYEGAITDVTADDVGNTHPLTILTGGTATNTYTALQTTTTVAVTKLWKDHQNENGVRPGYLKLGLFAPGATEPASIVTINGPKTDDAWNGTFTGLSIYDGSGAIIDYSVYVVKEAYPATLDAEGKPASWGDWIADGESVTITKDGKEYKYEYSIVGNP